jgi:hypothetical protein
VLARLLTFSASAGANPIRFDGVKRKHLPSALGISECYFKPGILTVRRHDQLSLAGMVPSLIIRSISDSGIRTDLPILMTTTRRFSTHARHVDSRLLVRSAASRIVRSFTIDSSPFYGLY